MERLQQQMKFILEVDKVKQIIRQTYLADGSRKENDAEHSWHLALMAVLLKEYANEEVDLAKVIPMVLLHDLVEIDAGDTYAYDQAGLATQRARETKAADRIFGMLPEDQGTKFRNLWEEFEAYETAEAKFAHVLDNCQPLLLKIDIYDIPIVEITDQYMEYLHSMEQEDLGTMSEFMVMAATLLDIKCKMLLPKEVNEEGEEEDPREELVQKLLEYKMYKYMSYELKDYMDNAAGVFYKNPSIPDEVLKYREPVDPAELLAGLTLEKLNNIYQSILKKQESKIDPIRSKFGTSDISTHFEITLSYFSS